MNIIYKDFSGTTNFHDGKVPYITFNNLDKLDFIKHGFSTRLGGVSEGEYSTMNLTFTREDDPAKVSENFEIMGKRLGIKPSQMVYAHQTHTTNVMKVTAENCGMGITRERDFSDMDGLITNIPGICLVTSYADCVPLFFADPVNKAIGLSHSGWRGTVNNIAKNTIELMEKEFGSNPKDIIAFIGPSIGKCCYEVGEDVAVKFTDAYDNAFIDGILKPIEPFCGKFMLDLQTANYINFLNSGLKAENISITDICTCCNNELLFSHRFTQGKRGGLCGFLMIKE